MTKKKGKLCLNAYNDNLSRHIFFKTMITNAYTLLICLLLKLYGCGFWFNFVNLYAWDRAKFEMSERWQYIQVISYNIPSWEMVFTPLWKEAASLYLLSVISSFAFVLKVITPNWEALGPNWKWPAKAFTKFFCCSKSALLTLPDSSIRIPTSTLHAEKVSHLH